jgi:hypothetical protein
MGRPSTSTDVLIEILSLCEQALTSLHPHDESDKPVVQSDKTNHPRYRKRAKLGPCLVLIPGGLSTAHRGGSTR